MATYPITGDVITHGDTWCAWSSAIAAAMDGSRSVLVNPTGTLDIPVGVMDLGRFGSKTIGTWINYDFYSRLAKYMGSFVDTRRAPPSLVWTVAYDMIKTYGVNMVAGSPVASVAKSGTDITGLTLVDGRVINNTANGTYVEASEDVELAKMAGCGVGSGRESSLAYGESLNGFHPMTGTFIDIDTSGPLSGLAYGMSPYPALLPGDADDGMQVNAWRLFLTADPIKQLPWKKPAGYNPDLFAIRRRIAEKSWADPRWRPWNVDGNLPYRMVDVNSEVGFGWNSEFPNATLARKAEITQLMFDEFAGWAWFLDNDPSVPKHVRLKMTQWKLANDEFTGSALGGGWPKKFYRRGSLRLTNPLYMMKQADMLTDITKTDGIAMSHYWFDYHSAKQLVVSGGMIRDGMGAESSALRATIPHEVPVRCMLTPDVTNIIVPNGAGCTAIANSVLRIDDTKGRMGAAAGYIASKAKRTATPMASLTGSVIRTEVAALGQAVSYTIPS